MAAYMHVQGYAMRVKWIVLHDIHKTQDKNSQMSQKKQPGETLKYPNIPHSFCIVYLPCVLTSDDDI